MKTVIQPTHSIRTLLATSTLLAGGLALANPAAAIPPISFGNSRDCQEFDNGSVATFLEESCSLQSLLDDATISGGIDVVSDLSSVETFSKSDGQVLAALMFEVAGFKNHNTFGIYTKDNTANTLEIFAGSDSPPDSVVLEFLSGGLIKNKATGVTTNIGSEFGYYITNKEGNSFYTQTGRNFDGRRHAAIYEGNGSTFDLGGHKDFDPGDFIIAFEDVEEGHAYEDFDYQDLVVMVQETESVPEPSVMLGLGAIAGSLLATRKRNRR